MRNLSRPSTVARHAGGFTLVELLVVIGIIAILAGVALGPISSGLRQAKESAAMQTCRTLALAEFQYMTDNQNYPDGATGVAAICQALMGGNYVTDPGVFRISGDPTASPPSNGAASMTASNCTYDFMGASSAAAASSGIPTSAPDLLPVVWAPSTLVTAPTGLGGEIPAASGGSGIFGTDGVAIGYKSNNAFFRTPGKVGAANPWPPAGDVLVVDKGIDMTPATYGETSWDLHYGSTGK